MQAPPISVAQQSILNTMQEKKQGYHKVYIH